MRKAGLYTDFSIRIDDVVIACHRNILAVGCEYFDTMFQSGYKEASDGVLALSNVNVQVVTDIISYIYMQEITIDFEKVVEYLDIAEMFLLKDLKEKVNDVIDDNLTVDNCVQCYQICHMYQLTECCRKVKQLIASNIDVVALNEDFTALSFDEVMGIVSEQNITCRDADAKAKTAVAWILKEKKQRTKYLKDFIAHIDLKRSSPSYLKDMYQEFKDYFTSNRYIDDEIKAAIEYTEKQPSKMIIFGGWNDFYRLNHDVWVLDLYGKNDFYAGELPEPLQADSPARCVTPHGVFQTGGKRSGLYMRETNAECYLFHPLTTELIHLPDIPHATSTGTATCVDDSVFVLSADHANKMVQRLDFKNKKWTRLRNMIIPAILPIVWSVAHQLFVLSDSIEGLKDVFLQCYDTMNDIWSLKSPPPAENITKVNVLFVDEDAYLVGGEGCLCLRYIVEQDMWETLPQPSVYSDLGIAFYASQRIFLCGRFAKFNYESDMEEFDIVTECWKKSAMKSVLHELNGALLSDLFCLPY